MATTTNYGWTTPDDTALVKDGAAAIRTLGTSVDTTTKNLNPETTLGDISYRSSTANVNTRLPLGTAGQVLKVNSGATAPEWSSDNAGMTNPMTTTGDTIYSSSGSTPARLAIGSTGNVLTVAGGVPTWAAPAGGGMDLLATVDASAATGVSFTSISGTYDHLLLIWQDVFQSSTSTFFNVKFNNNSNNYYWAGALIVDGVVGNTWSGNSSQIGGNGNNAPIPKCSSSDIVSQNCNGQMWIYNYASASIPKRWQLATVGNNNGQSNGNFGSINTNGIWDDTAAITQIDFVRNSSQDITGKFQLWGVK